MERRDFAASRDFAAELAAADIQDGRCRREITVTPNNEDTVTGKKIYIDLIEQAPLSARALVPKKLHYPDSDSRFCNLQAAGLASTT